MTQSQFSELKMTPLDVLFCPINRPQPKDNQLNILFIL